MYDSIINDTLTGVPERGPALVKKPALALPSLREAASPQPLPFIGRDAELAALQSTRALGRVALIEGEPGIGKTRLAEEFMHTANAITLVGRAHELEQLLPYQPVIEALRSLLARADWPALHAAVRDNLSPVWLAEVARLVPELDASAPEPSDGQPRHLSADESRLWEGLHQFLAVLSGQHPVMVFIDDLQWADASTLGLLGYLIRQPERAADIFYFAAARPLAPRSPSTTLLQTLTRQDRLTRLQLRRLTAHDLQAIARALGTNDADALVDWLASSSEGNPYVLVELLRHARESNLIRADGQLDLAALSKAPVVPQTIYSLAQSRLGRLSGPARRLLDAAVAAGREFDFDIVYHAAGISESAGLDALDELQAAGLVHPLDWSAESPSGRALYAFDHSVTMEVAYREVGEARHRLLHRRIAETMETAHRTHLERAAGLIAFHFIEGVDPERAAPYAFRAGKSAESLAAWAEAIGFYEQALLGETDSPRRFEILRALAGARMQAGEAPQASEALLEALALARQVAETTHIQAAQIALGESMLAQARFTEAIAWAQQLLDARPGSSAIAASAEAIWGTALSLEGADLAGAAEHLQRAAALLRDESQPVDLARLSQITFELGSVAAQQGDLRRAVGLYRDALSLVQNVDAGPGLQQRILAHNNLAYHLLLLGQARKAGHPAPPLDGPTALDYARQGLRLAQEKGVPGLQTFLLSTLGEIALAAGDLDTAEQRFDAGLAIAERLAIPERIAGLTANLGLVALTRGQTDLAIHRLSTALARADSLGTRHLAAQIRLWLAPLLPAGEARACLAEVRVMAEGSGRTRLLEEVETLEHTLFREEDASGRGASR